VELAEGDFCQDLLAGQTIDAGDVCLTVEGGDLVISYLTENGWELAETHLWAGANLADMPQTRKGAPQIGQFPYASGDITGATSYEVRVPLSTFGLTGEETRCDAVIFSVAAHAALRKDNGDGTYQTETGWADGDTFVDRGTWATFFSGQLVCSETGGGTGEQECETAFAFGGESAACFLDIDEDGDGNGDFNRWGWSNGPLGPGAYTFEVYAGAGQCDLQKGTYVGTLSVDYDGSMATVTYDADPSGAWFWEETHLYVGNEILARNVNDNFTVAPGQFPNIHDDVDSTTDTYVVEGLSGDIYVVAHAVSCEQEVPPPPPVVYSQSSFVASAAETTALPTDEFGDRTSAGSVQIVTWGGVSGNEPAYRAAHLALRNGIPSPNPNMLEQKNIDRAWTPSGLDGDGCTWNSGYPVCYLSADAQTTVLEATLPDHVADSNDGYDSTGNRVTIASTLHADYAAFTDTDNGHQTITVTWEVPTTRSLSETDLLLRAGYDWNCGGSGTGALVDLFRRQGGNTLAHDDAVEILSEEVNKLTVAVNVQTGLEAVRDVYLGNGLPLEGACETP